MKKIALAATLAAFAGLPACTTFNPERRALTDWNMGLIREKADPCGSMSDLQDPAAAKCRMGRTSAKADGGARKVINWVFVKPVAFVMLPVSWLADTLIVNPIDGYKKAELDSHERRFCTAEECGEEWSDAHAAHHAYGVVPVATPWVVSDALAAPEFAARWIWNSVSPTDPVNQESYEAYWREHNEETGK